MEIRVGILFTIVDEVDTLENPLVVFGLGKCGHREIWEDLHIATLPKLCLIWGRRALMVE